MVRSRSPTGMRKVSPAVTAALLARASLPRKVPAVDAVQRDMRVRLGVRNRGPLDSEVFEMAPPEARYRTSPAAVWCSPPGHLCRLTGISQVELDPYRRVGI